MVTTQSADSVLKSYYLDAVAQQLDLKTNPLLAAIERTTSDVWGKDVKKPVIFGVHGGVSAGSSLRGGERLCPAHRVAQKSLRADRDHR